MPFKMLDYGRDAHHGDNPVMREALACACSFYERAQIAKKWKYKPQIFNAFGKWSPAHTHLRVGGLVLISNLPLGADSHLKARNERLYTILNAELSELIKKYGYVEPEQ